MIDATHPTPRPGARAARRRTTYWVAVLVTAAVAASCGSDDDASTTAPAGTTGTVAGAPATSAPVATDAGTASVPATSGATGGLVRTVTTELGDVLADADGLSLYGFLNDTDGTSACYEQCAQNWPPLVVDGAELPDGLDPAVFSVTERTDGAYQLVAGEWPLYTYFEDGAEGDTFGQGVGEVWFLVDPAGELIEAAAAGLTAPATTAGGRYADDYGYGG